MSGADRERLSVVKVLAHLAVMAVVAVVLGVITAGLAIPFAGALGVGAREVAKSVEKLPAELVPEDLNQRTQMVDREGNVIATLYAQNRVNVPLSQISRTMVKAIVAIEDYRFYQHGALDLRGTLRAFITNQSADGNVQGGSSITQQLVKLTLISQGNKEERRAATADTYARKIRELRYAIAFEKKYSKDWILERYLNTAYFGDGAYGVQAAARHYFGVNAKDLDLRQSALLAGLVKNPSGYDPTNAPDRAFERRNTVLDRMAELKVIKRKVAKKTKKMPLDVDTERLYNGCINSKAPFFCDYVYNYLIQDPDLGDTVKQRKNLLKRGGLTIRTTIDLRAQAAADASVGQHVYPKDNAIGALAMVKPGTGEVEAVAQSRPMGFDTDRGQTSLNYAVPQEYGDSNGFQPGSTFKAFVLAAAIRQGEPMSEKIPSPQQIDLPMSEFPDCDGNYQSTDTWDPENSTDAPAANDMYTGTRLSVNTYFAQLEQRTGLCEPYKLAKEMGVRLTNPDLERVPSFTLGVSDVSALEMAEAYATFAARGMHCESRPVLSITDSSGKTMKEYDDRCKQVLPSAVADAVNEVMRGVMEGDGFGSGLAIDSPSAGKTGTTNDNKAVWFVGYTPEIATASMIAGVKEENGLPDVPDTLNGKTVGGTPIFEAFGSTVAGPMWGDAMTAIASWLPDTDFTAPPTGEIEGLLRTVPDVSGQGYDAAAATLENLGFEVALGGEIRSRLSEGTVVYSSPGSGSTFGEGDTIYLYVSNGVPPRPQGDGNGGGGGGGNDGPGNGNGNGNGNGGGGRD